jgi:hypothetical protein
MSSAWNSLFAFGEGTSSFVRLLSADCGLTSINPNFPYSPGLAKEKRNPRS